MIFDIIVLVAVALSVAIAALRGFIREALTIVGVVGGLATAYFGGPVLAPLMRDWLGVKVPVDGVPAQKLFDVVPMTLVADFCAYGLIFLLVVITLTVLIHFLATGIKALGLGPVDRILGAAFGVVRAVLLLALIYLPVYLISNPTDRDQWFSGSRTRPYVEQTSIWINSFLPKTAEDKTAQKKENSPVNNLGNDLGNALDQKMDELNRQYEKMDALKSTADKAGSVIDSAKDALDRKGDLTTNPATSDFKGYQQDQREGLDELIENNQNQ